MRSHDVALIDIAAHQWLLDLIDGKEPPPLIVQVSQDGLVVCADTADSYGIACTLIGELTNGEFAVEFHRMTWEPDAHLLDTKRGRIEWERRHGPIP